VIRVGGKTYRWKPGMTVADLLEEIRDPYPYVVVRINERYVSRPDFEKTPIPDGAEVFLVPMIAGG